MIDFFVDNDFLFLKTLLCFAWASLITYISIPTIILVSIRKDLVDKPSDRSSHTKKIPNLGGVAIFFSLMVVSSIFIPDISSDYIFFNASLLILFFIGFLDDILVVRARVKIYAQIIASAMLVIGSDFRIESFYGILGIYEIPYLLSVVFTIFVFIILNNSFNLIDGIDGLAGFVSIISLSIFGYIFYETGSYQMFLLAVTIIGSVFVFLYFNLSKRLKIFMGDTGTMVVGFLITFLIVYFIKNTNNTSITKGVAPVLAVSIFIIPIIDTISVIFLRLIRLKNPLSPDKNHLHHRFLKLGFNHIQTSFFISLINIFIVFLTFYFIDFGINKLLFTMVITAFFISYLPMVVFYFLKK